MKSITTVKAVFLAAMGLLNAVIVSSFGGWTTSMKTMWLFMGIDYATGWLISAVFKNSTKTPDGRYNSNIGWKGIVKKCVMVLLVSMAYRVDILLNTGTFIFRDGTATAFIVNDAMSIIENARDMGVPVPDILVNMVSTIKNNDKTVSKNGMIAITALIGSSMIMFAQPAEAAPTRWKMPEWGEVFVKYEPNVLETDIDALEDFVNEEVAPWDTGATIDPECEEIEEDHIHGTYEKIYADPEDERISIGICACGEEIAMMDFEDTNPWEKEAEEEIDEEDGDNSIPVSMIWDGTEEGDEDEDIGELH